MNWSGWCRRRCLVREASFLFPFVTIFYDIFVSVSSSNDKPSSILSLSLNLEQRRLPITVGHCWGMALMRLTRCYPKINNREIIANYFNSEKGEGRKPAMFVANHCSWMDIPFMGAVMGWRNYKIVAKKELGAVPILGTAIYAGGHIMVDRTDRRSQIRTLKQGINYLKKVRLFACSWVDFESPSFVKLPASSNFRQCGCQSMPLK